MPCPPRQIRSALSPALPAAAVLFSQSRQDIPVHRAVYNPERPLLKDNRAGEKLTLNDVKSGRATVSEPDANRFFSLEVITVFPRRTIAPTSVLRELLPTRGGRAGGALRRPVRRSERAVRHDRLRLSGCAGRSCRHDINADRKPSGRSGL